jgi:pilus assembly protein TadC
MFVFPAVVCGFIMCFPTLHIIDNYIFDPEMGMEQTALPSKTAVLQGLFIGLFIPLVSSISPIKNALSKNLNDSLDTNRSKTQAMYVEILDQDKQNMTSYITFGLISVVYGLSIYYFLPLAMLSFNFALILEIFFFILVGMLFGLSLLAFNL